MKESRIIIIILIIMGIILIPLLFVLQMCGLDRDLSINIITNLECGVTVGLVTAICQYFTAKRRIINSVYELYFDLYRTYYTAKNKSFLYHYNAISIFKKLTELSPKINESLGEYHGFFKRKNSMYMKMDPQVKMSEGYKAKNIIKTLFLWFNKKSFNRTIEPFIKDIEKILIDIDKERFEKDKHQMENMFDFMWN